MTKKDLTPYQDSKHSVSVPGPWDNTPTFRVHLLTSVNPTIALIDMSRG